MKTIHAIIIFVSIMLLIFLAFYAYKHGSLPFGTISTTVSSSGNTNSTTSTTSTATTSTSNGIANIIANIDYKAIISTIIDKLIGVFRWIATYVKSSSVLETVIRGSVISVVFFVMGMVSMFIAKLIRFICYALGTASIIFTILAIMGLI